MEVITTAASKSGKIAVSCGIITAVRMSRSSLLVIFVLSGLCLVLGYNYVAKPFANPRQAAQIEQKSPSALPATSSAQLPAQGSFEAYVLELSSAEKLAQLMAFPVSLAATKTATNTTATNTVATTSTSLSPELQSVVKFAQTRRIGVVSVFGSNISAVQLRQFVTAVTSTSDAQTIFRPIVAVDHEGGQVQRASGVGFTRLPSWQQLCQMEPAAMATLVEQSANELKAAGVEMVWGPVVDIGVGGVMADRLCSDDRLTVFGRGSIVTAIYHKVGLFPVLKHFPGIGATKLDSHKTFEAISVASESAAVFAQVLGTQPETGVMVSHVGVLNQFPELPCSLSLSCIGVLKNATQTPLILSDALEMKATDGDREVLPERSLAQKAREAWIAGNDILTFGAGMSQDDFTALMTDLVDEYNSNAAFRSVIDQRLERVWTWRRTQFSLQ